MTTQINLTDRARIFATAAHAAVGQVRKYSGNPYIVHPARVAATVRMWGGDEQQIAAAWLHDTVEDTQITLEDIRREFGDDVAHLVEGLTDISVPEDGNRKARKAKDRAHSIATCARTQLVKCADLQDNTVSIVRNDPGFAVTFLKEKAMLLDGFTKVDRKVWNIVNDQLIAVCHELEVQVFGDAV